MGAIIAVSCSATSEETFPFDILYNDNIYKTAKGNDAGRAPVSLTSQNYDAVSYLQNTEAIADYHDGGAFTIDFGAQAITAVQIGRVGDPMTDVTVTANNTISYNLLPQVTNANLVGDEYVIEITADPDSAGNSIVYRTTNTFVEKPASLLSDINLTINNQSVITDLAHFENLPMAVDIYTADELRLEVDEVYNYLVAEGVFASNANGSDQFFTSIKASYSSNTAVIRYADMLAAIELADSSFVPPEGSSEAGIADIRLLDYATSTLDYIVDIFSSIRIADSISVPELVGGSGGIIPATGSVSVANSRLVMGLYTDFPFITDNNGVFKIPLEINDDIFSEPLNDTTDTPGEALRINEGIRVDEALIAADGILYVIGVIEHDTLFGATADGFSEDDEALIGNAKLYSVWVPFK